MIGSFVILSRNNNNEVFLVKRSDYGVWEIQGGGIEKGESPEQTAIREAQEETSFKIKIIQKVAEYKSGNKITKHVYQGKVIGGTYTPEYDGCVGKWFNIDAHPHSMTAIMKRILNDYKSNQKHIISKDIPNLSPKNIYLIPTVILQRIFKLFSV